MIFAAIARWHPMASIVIVMPLMSMRSSSSGIATISFSLCSTRTWPRHKPCSVKYALTLWIALLPEARSKLPRSVLPSIAMWSPPRSPHSSSTHRRNSDSKARGSIAASTRRKVSCEGMPCCSAQRRRNHSSFSIPKISMASAPSAPARTPTSATNRTSQIGCRSPRRSRGSGMSRVMVSRTSNREAVITGAPVLAGTMPAPTLDHPRDLPSIEIDPLEARYRRPGDAMGPVRPLPRRTAGSRRAAGTLRSPWRRRCLGLQQAARL